MRAKKFLFLLAAFAIGLVTPFGVKHFEKSSKEKPRATEKIILVVRNDIPIGSIITPEMVKSVSYPAELAPTGAFSNYEEIGGRATRIPVLAGEPITEHKFNGGGMPPLIPLGMRAVTVRVSEHHAVSGLFVAPGDHVDVILSISRRQEMDAALSRTNLQNMKVLALETLIDPDDIEPTPKLNAVTLLATVEQAELLTSVQSVGTVSLSLRNQADKYPTTTPVPLPSENLGDYPPPGEERMTDTIKTNPLAT